MTILTSYMSPLPMTYICLLIQYIRIQQCNPHVSKINKIGFSSKGACIFFD